MKQIVISHRQAAMLYSTLRSAQPMIDPLLKRPVKELIDALGDLTAFQDILISVEGRTNAKPKPKPPPT